MSCGIFNNPNAKKMKSHKELKLKDNNLEPIGQYFWLAHDFIENARNNKEAVMVHCLKGMSRSATIVISYVMINQ